LVKASKHRHADACYTDDGLPRLAVNPAPCSQACVRRRRLQAGGELLLNNELDDDSPYYFVIAAVIFYALYFVITNRLF
jgi:hypothetical protein